MTWNMKRTPFDRLGGCCASILSGPLLALLSLVALPAAAGPGDARFLGVLKGQQWLQTNAGPLVPDGPTRHVFRAFLDPWEGATNYHLYGPGGGEILFDPAFDGSTLETVRLFPTAGERDAVFPNGLYTFAADTISDGRVTNQVAINGDLYPIAPALTNYPALQTVDPAAPLTLGWGALAGGTTNDFIQVQVSDCGGERVLETPAPRRPGALDGTATSVQIPARRLRPGRKYDIEILVVRFAAFGTNVPGAIVVAGYFQRTRSWLVTVGTPAGCPPGNFQLMFQSPFFQLGASTQGVVSFPSTLETVTANFGIDGRSDSNFPPNVRFSGPGGAVWADETNYWGSVSPFSAWYGSRAATMPPFPPGGIYTVNYRGTNLQFNLLDPEADREQVLFVPTAIVDAGGYLTEVQWRTYGTNGVPVGPQPFMTELVVRVETESWFYDSKNYGIVIGPAESSHVLADQIPWAAVRRLQLGFWDAAGNQFITHWERNGLANIEITTTQLPGGRVGVPYNAVVLSRGGIDPRHWMLDTGSLPPGLNLNVDTGEISGVPENSGEYPVVLRVMDSQEHSTSREFVLVIQSGDGPGIGQTPNLGQLLVAKGLAFVQSNAVGAVAVSPSNSVFRAEVSFRGPTSVTNVELNLPNGSTVPVPPKNGGGDPSLIQWFASIPALDAVFPNGSYEFRLDTADGGRLTNRVGLNGNSYPPTPRINNFLAAQAVNPTNGFTLAWDPLAGATTNDVIFVEISDCRGWNVFSTPGPAEPGSLSGLATNVVIPPRTFRPGQRYSVQIIVARLLTQEETDPPGGRRLTGYFKQLETSLATIGFGDTCPEGDLRLVFTFRPGRIQGLSGVTMYPSDISFYTVQYSMALPPNLPEVVKFSGPPGSGLNNSDAAYRGSDDRQAWFSSANVTTPPYPFGGRYVVSLDDQSRPHTLLDPNVAGQKVLLVPTFSTNSDGGITNLSWTYRDAAGGVIAPPGFIQRLRLWMSGPEGGIWSNDGSGPGLRPPQTNVVIDPPVPWSALTALQTGFEDPSGNMFLADWRRGGSQVEIVTFALPGVVVSNAYQGVLEALGGLPPYRWSVDNGVLPSGLALGAETGVITGTPGEIGRFEFTVRVTDANESTTTSAFVIFVRPPGPDAAAYIVAKGRRFGQTSAAPPGPQDPGFQFTAFVDEREPERILGASLELPNGMMATLERDFRRFALEALFPTQLELDAAYANGAYRFAISTVHDGTPTVSLVLSNNLYPAAPRVANWPAAQAIDAARDFLLAWDPFPGGTTNDTILVEIADERGGDIFGSPDFLDPAHLDGTRTNLLIPGGVLIPGASQRARVMFVRPAQVERNAYPGVPGVAAYFAQTDFGLSTLNPAGEIRFTALATAVDENSGTVRVPVVRAGGRTGDVTVYYSVIGGSAEPDVDFVLAGGSIDFADGVGTNYITIELNNDDLPEPPETIRLELGEIVGGASPGRPSQTEVTIRDDDRPPGSDVEFYVAAKGQSFRQTGPALPAPDTEQANFFAALARGAFPGALNSAAVKDPSGGTNEMAGDDDNRHFEFMASFDSKAGLDAAFARGDYTFLLDTASDGVRTPVLGLGVDAYPNAPHLSAWGPAHAINAFADFTLAWDPMIGGRADDFILVSIRDGDTFETIFETPDLLKDGALDGAATSMVIPGGLLEPGRTYACEILFVNVMSVNLAGYPGAKGLTAYVRQTRTTIATATPPPPGGQIQFAEPVFSVSETNGPAVISLVRVGGTEGEVSVVVATTNGTATAVADFTAQSTVVTFADGVAFATFTVPILDDAIFEGPETVRLGLRSVTGAATLAGQTNALLTIVDNELSPTPGTIQFSVTSAPVPEAAGTVTLTVLRTGGSAGEVSVDYETADGSALSGEDFAGDAGTLVFGPGVTSRTLAIEIVPDALDESNEVFTVTLANPSNGATLGERRTATVTIADDDSGGQISFGTPEYRVSESDEEAVISVRRTGGTAEGVTVDYATVEDTALEDVDYMRIEGTLTFDAGQTEASFVVPILDDALSEGNERLRLILTNATGGAVLGRITNAPLQIIDDEVVVQFARAYYTNSEAGPLAVLTVVRSGALTETVSVDYMTDDETAFAGEDYTEAAGTITFGPGVSSRTVSVPVLNDGLVEEDETFVVSLLNPVGAQIGEVDTAAVLIVDNDDGGSVAFVTTTVPARENSPVALLTVTRSGGRADGVSVDFTIEEGTATAGEDFVTTNGTLYFAEGVTRMTIAVPLVDDALDEETETFTVQLSNVTGGATLGESSLATVSILDNDVAGSVRFASTVYTVSETGGVATVTVLRSGGKAGGVTVDYEAGGGTAVEDDDYTPVSGTLTFEANEASKTFEIPLASDGVPDGNKTVLLTLTNPGGGARLLSPTNATLNIVDSSSSVQFASATYSISEGVRSLVLTVVRSGPPGTVSVNYATADGTATSPADYRGKTGVLTFAGTATSRTISIPLINDRSVEGDETFTVTLTNPTGGAQLGAQATATVTIVDNDVAPAGQRAARRR